VLIQTDDGSPLELIYNFVAIPPDMSAAHSFEVFEDAEEEGAIIHQCMLNSHVDKIVIISSWLSRVARSLAW
jgi:hypothetical protein